MKGLGRNVRFSIRHRLKYEFRSDLMVLIFCLIIHGLREGINPFMNVNISAYLLGFILVTTLINSMSYSNTHLSVMVSMGSARKAAALGVICSHHLFMIIKLVILLVIAVLSDGKCSMLIRTCPMGLISVMLMLLGVGIICASLSMKGRNGWAAVFMLGFIVIFVAVCVVYAWQHDFELKVEMLKPYNNLLALVPGVVIDLIGASAYYKIAQKIDLKLI